jgi:DUF4097 and DUF4098 domain-containing protein YvlB
MEGRSQVSGERIRVINVYFAVALLLSVLLVAGCDDDTSDYRLEETETLTWSTSGITNIDATTLNGNVSVEASTDTVITCIITRVCYGKDRADAENYIDNIVVTDSINSGVLTVVADMPDNSDRNYSADLEILAPEGVHIDLTTTNGNLSAVNMVDGAEFTTTNGNISSENLEGGVTGQITNGNASCDLAVFTTPETATLLTTNGNLQLSVPADVSATFDARTANGSVTVTGFSSVSYTTNQPMHKAGTIGPPPNTAVIALTVVNGNAAISAR